MCLEICVVHLAERLFKRVLIILSVFLSNLKDMALFSHLITCKIFVISSDLVNHSTIWKDFHNTVCSCLNKLMIMRGEKNYPGNLIRPLFNAVMDSISRWLVGSSRIRMLAPEIIILERRQRTFSPPESTRTRFTPSSPGKSIRPRKPRT